MLISFIMPAFKGMYLAQALESILKQSSDDWELVVVDDCSPDDIEGIVRSFNDDRIRYYRNAENIGGRDLVRQWNHCLQYASGDWVVLAGDDDLYLPEFAQTVAALAARYPQVKLIRSRVEQIDGEGRHLWDDATLPEYLDKMEYFKAWMDARIFDCIGNFAFRRDALTAIGGFVNLPCAFGTDIITPVLLSSEGAANTDGMLFRFRQSDIHLSSDSSKFPQKMAGITGMYDGFSRIGYLAPFQQALHKKCIYDYFNLVVRHVGIGELFPMLRLCTNATVAEKAMMVARWIKRRLKS